MKMSEADLRKRIRPGDKVNFMSMKACIDSSDVSRNSPIPATGVAISVFKDFALVKLKRVVDTANRAAIISVNGRELDLGRTES